MGLVGIANSLARKFGRSIMKGEHADGNDVINSIRLSVAKHGPGNVKIENLPKGVVKTFSDPRLEGSTWHRLVITPDDARQLVKDLPKEKNLCADYLNTLLRFARKKEDVRQIISYVRSTAASNLSPDQSARLIIACSEKLKYIDIITQFLH